MKPPGGNLKRVPLSRTSRLEPGTPPARTARLGRNVQLRAVSARRARENRQRAAMADRRWPDRREGTVMCGCGRPECNRRADDLHEPKFRSRLGSITDPDNAIPVSRECHAWIHAHPREAAELGLAVHSWE